MSQLTHTQLVWRGRIESGLRVAAPLLDLLLLAGDQLSRLASREERGELEPAPADDQEALGAGRG